MVRPTKARTPAIAYLRTSSASNVGADKDSEKRQGKAIARFAKRNGFERAPGRSGVRDELALLLGEGHQTLCCVLAGPAAHCGKHRTPRISQLSALRRAI